MLMQEIFNVMPSRLLWFGLSNPESSLRSLWQIKMITTTFGVLKMIEWIIF